MPIAVHTCHYTTRIGITSSEGAVHGRQDKPGADYIYSAFGASLEELERRWLGGLISP